jgi:hypothetical protein
MVSMAVIIGAITIPAIYPAKILITGNRPVSIILEKKT